MPGFFDPPKPRQFDFKPRYYSEEKERIEMLKRRINEDAASDEIRNERIREAFARNRPLQKKHNKVLTSRRLVIYVFLVILLIMLISNAKWLVF